MIRLHPLKWLMPLLNLWLKWKSFYHNPSLLQDTWMTKKRNFTHEWPGCSDQCNLEMCHELFYNWCWFCDISSFVVVTVTSYLYLCVVHFFYFELSSSSVVRFLVCTNSDNPVSLFSNERFVSPLSHNVHDLFIKAWRDLVHVMNIYFMVLTSF